MTTSQRKGFTLIEILIVVAIIAILASVILVGLGPTQSLGRDARRVADLHEIQNGLELYYNATEAYPVGTNAAWTKLGPIITKAVPSVTNIPSDPGKNGYVYGSDAAGLSYVLQATLENKSGGPWAGYTAPAAATVTADANYFGSAAPDCTVASAHYCVSL